jgi:starch synthase (maltosyl-transferring)
MNEPAEHALIAGREIDEVNSMVNTIKVQREVTNGGPWIPEEAAQRVRIENVEPEIDGGRYPAKRVTGELVVVTVDLLVDGHDALAARLGYRRAGDDWTETPMRALKDDRWIGSFPVSRLGEYEFKISAWIDRFESWRNELGKKAAAGQDVSSELLEGARLVRGAAERAGGGDGRWLEARAGVLEEQTERPDRVKSALDADLAEMMAQYADRTREVSYEKLLKVTVERQRALCGAWYEMFPRSAGSDPNRSATFHEAEARLTDIAAMGFDVLYLPPIHPIGKTNRKGPNNSLQAGPEDPGSPWAIGSPDGGHKAVDPALGSLEDFDRFVASAERAGLEVALDLAFQCSPDHPYVREHPEWFRHRPDGSIKYAENPPKKYQDIYPLALDCNDWQALWRELKSVVIFWIEHGVRIFRVDNPHTKTFGFWEWMIAEVRIAHADVIFLSEAFTRRKIMYHLAKIGFSQSYTYFTWRNTKTELTEYLNELTQTPVRNYMRPNFFTNTPDILHEYLQFGGRAAFQVRLVLAATLGASYGIYGPSYELCVASAVPGTEEYQDSEKYQVRVWDRRQPGNIKEFITRVNRIRRENAALQSNWNLQFLPVDNEALLFYVKTTPDLANIVLVVVNLDPHHPQSGWVRMPLTTFGIDPSDTYQVHDLLGDGRFLWQGEVNFVRLDPSTSPAHIFRLRRKIKTERDFDYFL